MLRSPSVPLAALATLCSASAATAALVGSASLTANPLGGGQFGYTATVSNTGTTTIGTFWFAWIPGQNYLPVLPTNITSPAGWTATIVGGSGAASIRWAASSAASFINPGASLGGFGFNAFITPQAMDGFAQNFPTQRMATSFFYSAGPFSDSGFQFIASVVPSPAGAAAVGLLLPAACLRRRRH
ncbi:MAG: hypothetical protein JNJ48_08170 [Phycisphaerae bacterium]|nr:hypothetical protein [Phycisphaerae bacterium]